MKVHYLISISRGQDPTPGKSEFKAIVDLCLGEDIAVKSTREAFAREGYELPDVTVICSVHHPKLPELHSILDRMGCTVYEGINPKNHGPNPVRYEIIRRFSKKDILAAEYLYVDQ